MQFTLIFLLLLTTMNGLRKEEKLEYIKDVPEFLIIGVLSAILTSLSRKFVRSLFEMQRRTIIWLEMKKIHKPIIN
ncbi:MAG: hypothetical protein ACTSRG_27095 [Candidatus Helarchaeota archaeon]